MFWNNKTWTTKLTALLMRRYRSNDKRNMGDNGIHDEDMEGNCSSKCSGELPRLGK